eukprot:658405-Amphidinium_carterae.1
MGMSSDTRCGRDAQGFQLVRVRHQPSDCHQGWRQRHRLHASHTPAVWSLKRAWGVLGSPQEEFLALVIIHQLRCAMCSVTRLDVLLVLCWIRVPVLMTTSVLRKQASSPGYALHEISKVLFFSSVITYELRWEKAHGGPLAN